MVVLALVARRCRAFCLAALVAGGLGAAPGVSFAAESAAPSSTGKAAQPLVRLVAGSEEVASETRHTLRIGGRGLDYRATAGNLVVQDAHGAPALSLFFVAYTLDGAPLGQRPIMFLFNGGPGSASLWLHLGSFGPVRVALPDHAFASPAAVTLGPNPDTLLQSTDLVFLDAPGSGFSRAIGKAKPSDFYSVDADVDAFSKAIQRYLTKFGRWDSPKFIYGESYGTTRAAALTYLLERRGVTVSGTILQSSALYMARIEDGSDAEYISALPTMAAVAWHYDRIPGGRPPSMEGFVDDARRFAAGPLADALAKGQTIDDTELADVSRKIAGFTGLPADFIEAAKLRVTTAQFQTELLRDRGLSIGELDGRYTTFDADKNAQEPEFDPSLRAIMPAYVSSFHAYLSSQLGLTSDLPYNVTAEWDGDMNWNYSHVTPSGQRQLSVNTADDLAAALRINPHLSVLSLNGWFDLDTPLFGTERDLSHMMLPAELQKNITLKYYPAGHMLYTSTPALHAVHSDLEQFIAKALGE